MSNLIYDFKAYNGQLHVYDDKVVIERNGVLGFASHGLAGAKTIPYTAIQSVQFKAGGALANGFIQFGVLGGKEAKRGVSSAVSDENSVIILKHDNAKAKEIADYIESRIGLQPSVTTIVNEVSGADEILKYKNLLDMGVITQEEFDAKKKQLLGL